MEYYSLLNPNKRLWDGGHGWQALEILCVGQLRRRKDNILGSFLAFIMVILVKHRRKTWARSQQVYAELEVLVGHASVLNTQIFHLPAKDMQILQTSGGRYTHFLLAPPFLTRHFLSLIQAESLPPSLPLSLPTYLPPSFPPHPTLVSFLLIGCFGFS